MKKYIILSFISLTAILTIFATGYTKINNINHTTAVKVESVTAVEKLSYNGTVEYSNTYVGNSDGTGVVQSVLVDNGDYVEKGTAVMIAYQTESDLSKSDILSAITSNDYDKIMSMFENDSSVITYEAKSSGIISDLDLEDGSVFTKGQTLFKISPEQSFQIQINVTEKDIPKVKIGQTVQIDCKAVPEILYGTISSIGNSAKQTTTAIGKETTIKVTVKIDGECDEIKPGYSASCLITVAEKENTLLVPYSAVGADESGESFVYLLGNSGLSKHYVICGDEYNNGLEIVEGLSVNDIIVFDVGKVDTAENTVVDEVSEYEQ